MNIVSGYPTGALSRDEYIADYGKAIQKGKAINKWGKGYPERDKGKKVIGKINGFKIYKDADDSLFYYYAGNRINANSIEEIERRFNSKFIDRNNEPEWVVSESPVTPVVNSRLKNKKEELRMNIMHKLAEDAIGTILAGSDDWIDDNQYHDFEGDYDWSDDDICTLYFRVDGKRIGSWDIDIADIEDLMVLDDISAEVEAAVSGMHDSESKVTERYVEADDFVEEDLLVRGPDGKLTTNSNSNRWGNSKEWNYNNAHNKENEDLLVRGADGKLSTNSDSNRWGNSKEWNYNNDYGRRESVEADDFDDTSREDTLCGRQALVSTKLPGPKTQWIKIHYENDYRPKYFVFDAPYIAREVYKEIVSGECRIDDIHDISLGFTDAAGQEQIRWLDYADNFSIPVSESDNICNAKIEGILSAYPYVFKALDKSYWDDSDWSAIEDYDGDRCKVVSTEIQGPDFESSYHNIEFKDGTELSAISGMHLYPVTRHSNRVKAEGNSVSSNIPVILDNFLQDVAQIAGTIDYSDIMNFKYTEKDKAPLNKLKRAWYDAVEDIDDDEVLQDIGRKIANYIKK